MDLQLKGKKAIVTGATRGIGRAIAEILANEGVDIAFTARNQADIDQTVAELQKKGVKVIGAALDAADGQGTRAWIETVGNVMGGIDILVLGASAFKIGNAEESWRAALEIDVLGVVHATDAAMPFLERAASENGDAAVVIISSVAAAEANFPDCYGAQKGAQVHLAKGLARSKAAAGVRVNLVSPGAVFAKDGPWDKIKANDPNMFETYVQTIPFGRMGRAEEIGNAVVFLASPAASYITGANLVIDGAMTARVNY